jgi:hypothetical protein
LPGSNVSIDRPKSRIVGPEQRSGLTWVSRRDPHGKPVFMQATNNALAEETGCAKDGDDRCDHSVPDIVKLLLWTREDCDRSTDLKPSQLVTSCATPACQSRSSAPVAVCGAMLSQAPEASGSSKRYCEAGMSAADRRQIQEALRRLDYYRGRADGIFGRGTRAAIRRFQQIGAATRGTLTADEANLLVSIP